MSWYRTGTVSLTNGSTTVVGVGTDFVSNTTSGAIFCAPDGNIYEIGSIDSSLSLELVGDYNGATVAGAAYAIAPTQSYIVNLATQAANLLNTFGSFRNAYLAGSLATGIQGVLSSASQLPTTGTLGNVYLIGSDLYVWSPTGWESSSIQGPQGPDGDVNPANLTAAANALASQNAAAASATAAAGSATAAAASATTASTEAATATTQAGNASTSATAAAGSATAAAGSATAAAGSATSLAAALASFKSAWLGQLAADPTVDGNGNPVVVGAEYFNTAMNPQRIRVYTSTGWQDQDALAETDMTNAALSASQAAGSAATATTQAGNAATSATAAAGSATTATSQAGIATAQAGNAANSATAAAGSVTTATNEAAIATTQAGNALTQAQNAAASAVAAAASAQQAAAGQVNADWNATSGVAKILNKPTFAAVAMSGNWSDLQGKPTFAAVATSGNYGDLTGLPSFATVATSGKYGDLTGTPAGYSLPPATAAALGGIKVGSNLAVAADGTLSAVATTSITFLPWANRASLRTTEGPASATVIVESLGMFIWTAGSTEPDDDETAFASVTGVWTMEVASYDAIYALLVAEFAPPLSATFQMTATSVSSAASVTFNVNVAGAMPGDTVIATPANSIDTTSARVNFTEWISAPNIVTVSIRNPSSNTAALTPSLWQVLVIKNPITGVSA